MNLIDNDHLSLSIFFNVRSDDDGASQSRVIRSDGSGRGAVELMESDSVPPDRSASCQNDESAGGDFRNGGQGIGRFDDSVDADIVEDDF